MFSSFKQRILLGIYIFLILSIPVGAYLASQQQTVKSRAQETASKPTIKPSPKPASPSAKLKLLEIPEDELENLEANPEPESSSPTVATSFGPTLSLKVSLEGRPTGNQTTKLFVGIVEGALAKNPKFLLSFNIDIPTSGSYSNLSIAGLLAGTSYTALLKGPAQIASSITFTMSPAVTNLKSGEAINLTSGDLNEDNTINSSDYSIVQKAYGATSKSSNTSASLSASWNENADFNKDGVINAFDLSVVAKNLSKTGASGVWTSPVATTSASLSTSPSGSLTPQGYWLWVPGH